MADEIQRHLTVAVALGIADWEAQFIAVLTHPSTGIRVARRCVDVSDLLAFSLTSAIDAVIVAESIAGIDAEAVGRLRSRGVVVAILTESPAEELRLRALDADSVVYLDRQRVPTSARAVGDVLRAAFRQGHEFPPEESSRSGHARFISVWGPPGSCGRSTTAVAVADEIARAGRSCALVDADCGAPALDQLLGITAAGGSIGWAQRHAAHGNLTRLRLLEAMPLTQSGVRVLLGSLDDSQLRAHLWRRVCDTLETAVEDVVCDLGSVTDVSLRADDLDASAVRETIERSQVHMIVGASDEVGLARLVRHLEWVARENLCEGVQPLVIITRLRPDDAPRLHLIQRVVVPRAEAIGARIVRLVDDPRACRAASLRGRTIAEVAPRSRLRREIQQLTQSLAA